MAVEALFHQTTPGVDALDLRRVIAALSGGQPGVLFSTDFVGTATSTTNFRVSAGTALINHNTAGNGQFVVTNDADVNQTINPPGSGTKYITVYLRLQDATLGDGANAGTVTKREETTATYGVPAGQSGIELYRIILPAGATLTSGATVTDVRPYVRRARGAIMQRSSPLSIPQDVVTFVPWETTLLNTDTFWSSGNPTRFTVPAGMGGLYEFGANVGWKSPGATIGDNVGVKVMRFYKNGAAYASVELPQSRWATWHSLTTPIYLVPNDYVEVGMLHNMMVSSGGLYDNVGGGPFIPHRGWLRFIAPV